MEKNETVKKRKQLLMIIPLLVLPFLTLAFWALGGGQGKTPVPVKQRAGINNNLPKAKLKISALDKMSLYAQADQDSGEMQNEAGSFRYPSAAAISEYTSTGMKEVRRTNNVKSNGPPYDFEQDPNEIKMQQKLSQLKAVMNQSKNVTDAMRNQATSVPPATVADAPAYGGPTGEQDLEKLKALISTAQDNDDDTDMKQINTMLNKIMDIQHPGRIEQRLKAQSAKDKGRVFSVERPQDDLAASFLYSPVVQELPDSLQHAKNTSAHSDAFYDIDAMGNTGDNSELTIAAVIAQTQTLVSGASVRMRLMQDVYVNGTLIPKNDFVYGICAVSGERLKISVQHIRYHNQLFPVSLSGYDLDAIEGIRIPDAVTRDAGKEGADRAIQSIQMMSLDPNIGTQAAAAGIEATKSLLSKKVKLVRVTVKADYPLLLIDAKGLQEEQQ